MPTFKRNLACAAVLTALLIPVGPAAASSFPTPTELPASAATTEDPVEEQPLIRSSDLIHQPTEVFRSPFEQSYTAPASAAKVELAPRGVYSVVVNHRISMPVPPVPTPSGFGPRTCSAGPCSTFHQGLDFAAAAGTPVKVVAQGVVTFAAFDGNFGNKVTVEHTVNGQSFTTIYAHMLDGSVNVSPGMTVERGTVLGQVGNTGRSYGAHLHFEVHVAGAGAVNPSVWLAERAIPYPG